MENHQVCTGKNIFNLFFLPLSWWFGAWWLGIMGFPEIPTTELQTMLRKIYQELVPTKMLKQFLLIFPCSILLIHICSHPELRLFWSIYSLLFTTRLGFSEPVGLVVKKIARSPTITEKPATSPVMPTNKEAEATCQISTFEDLRASTPQMPNTLTTLRGNLHIYI